MPAPVLLFLRAQASGALSTLALAVLAGKLAGRAVHLPEVLVVGAVHVHGNPPGNRITDRRFSWRPRAPAAEDAEGVLDRKNGSVCHGLMAREYRGWTIAVHSFETEMGKWHPVVTVSVETRRVEILTKRLFTPSEWAFDSEQESDERGYLLAVAWIDEGG